MATVSGALAGKIAFTPITPGFGSEIIGLDASRDIADEVWAELEDQFYERRLLMLRGLDLAPERIVALSRRLGVTETHIDSKYLLDGHPEIIQIGNLKVNGVMRSLFPNAREEWHFDYSYVPKPALGALFYSVAVPPSGGDTLFADSTAAYEALDPAEQARLEKLVCIHSWAHLHEMLEKMDPTRKPLSDEAKQRYAPVRHPLVFTHPRTGRKSLWLCPEVVLGIEGMSREASVALLEELTAFATGPAFSYRHKWRKGDLLMYDNRALLHTATTFDYENHFRLMYRTTILDAEPALSAAA